MRSQAQGQETSERESLTLDDLWNRLDSHSNQFRELRKEIFRLEEENEELREENNALYAEIEELRAREDGLQEQINELKNRTDLLDLIKTRDQTTGEQRSAALLQHLRNKARVNNGRGVIDHEEAMAALHHPEEIDRTTIYSDMRRAARFVGDTNVCWYDGGELFIDLLEDSGAVADAIGGVGT